MELETLTAISPIDGRYRNQLQHLDIYFSELALIKSRVKIEVEYLFFLAENKLLVLPPLAKKHLEQVSNNFSIKDAQLVKEREKITNHDVKAVEYFLKDELENCGAGEIKEWVHFGLTSQDINNTAIPLLWKAGIENEYLPSIIKIKSTLYALAKIWHQIPMLARTHGQPASPTTLGKEIMVFVERIDNQLKQFNHIPYTAKFGGATGNFNAHHIAYPHIDWIKFSDKFVTGKLGLQRQQFTTQIEHYDMLAAHFDNIKRINTILIDFCRDIWTYISMDYFKQKVNKNETGSSAMPHKVNPIDFENGEGNLGLANAILEHLANKLPVSRLQRDLTDSTVIRNIGVPLAHTILAFLSIEKGLKKLVLNEQKISEDLENNWAVISEAIQTILRRENYPEPYEALKELTRGHTVIDKKVMHHFIDGLKISPDLKTELKKITPRTYIGSTLL